MSEKKFDLIVIGSGPAGYVGAIRAAQLGLKTACIEKDPTLGGTCLNVGCIPSKALLDSSEHYHLIKHKMDKHGITTGDVAIDVPKMIDRKTKVVKQLTQGVDYLFKKNKIERFHGTGSFRSGSPGEVKVEVSKPDGSSELLISKNVLIATGSAPNELPFMPFDGENVLSSTHALELQSVPKHLVVVGGGVIGLEMGSVWLRLGARVTIVEFMDKFLAMMDQQVAKDMQKILTQQGMEFRLGTKCLGMQNSNGQLLVETEEIATGTKSQIECDKILVATGRHAYTDGLGLEALGIITDKNGRIEIGKDFGVGFPGVYAVGDVVRGIMLAHKAEDEAMAAVEIIAGQSGHVNYDAIPNVIYTWPELASVGKTEEELKAAGIEFNKGVFPFMANGRAKAMDEEQGMVKILADKTTDRVLGVHILGPRASDMIAEAVAVMEFGGSAEDIARTCHAHPTLAETFKEAALDVGKRKIHL